VIGTDSSATTHPAARFSGPARLGRPAGRIVSLLPSATEIVCALGLAERLVAVTHECDHPPVVVSRLPRLTSDRLAASARGSREIDAAVRSALSDGHGLYRLDDAALATLEPDLILTQELCRVCAVSYPVVQEAARALGGGNEPLVVSLEPESLDDVLETIRIVGSLAGTEERAERLVAGLGSRLASAGADSSPRRRVALVEWLDPLFAPGHWVPEMIGAAGGSSCFGTAGRRSATAAWDELAAADPQVVVLGLCGFDLERTLAEWRNLEVPEPLRRTSAWTDGELWAIDGSAYVSRPGPRLVDGVEILAAILCGEPDRRAARLTR
jgi:iron complex transport system substrate-binding protein